MNIAERVTVLRDERNLSTYWVRDLDQRHLGELITGHVFESSLKAPFSGKVEPMLEVRRQTRGGQYAEVDLEWKSWASSGAWDRTAPSLPSRFLG